MPKLWFAGLVLALAMRVPGFGQGETTSAIVGRVTDPAGAAIPGATVTVTNIENGLKRAVKADDAGRFSFPQLKPGMYAAKAEADGFERPAKNETVPAGLGQKQTVDFRLHIASASESILVQRAGAAHQHRESQHRHRSNGQAIENLPNPGRRSDISATIRRRRADQHRRQLERFRGRPERLRQRAVQRAAGAIERVHRGWTGNQRSADESEQRPLHQSGAGYQLHRRGDRQHHSPTPWIKAATARRRSTT